jgi:hypothetical protein
MAARSQSIRTTTPLRAFIRRPAVSRGLRLSGRPRLAIQIRQRGGHFSALLGAQPPNTRKPDGKLIGLHRIKLLKPDPSLTQINRYRYKRLLFSFIFSNPDFQWVTSEKNKNSPAFDPRA